MASEYQLTIEKRPLYLYACVQSASISRPAVREYLSEILDVFRTAQYSRLLLKKETRAALDADDFAFVATEIVRQGAQGLKIAIVDEFPDQAEINERGAVSARASGLDIAFFGSFAAAVHWLLHG